nr:serine hydrolase domain-containing protein [Pedobacter aquatilis]
MRTSLRVLLCLSFIILFHKFTLAQVTDSAYDAVTRPIFSNNGPGGAVLVAKAGEVVYQKAFGFANLEHQVTMSQDKVFRLGSVTKQFTAICILKLVEEGKLPWRTV